MSSSLGAVYVPASSARNLATGLAAGVWGFSEPLMARSNYLEQFRRLGVGDLLFLGHAGPSNRVPPGGWRDARLRSGHLGVITALTETASDVVWPDGPYPYRPSFDLLSELRDVSADAVGEDVMEALRLSSNQQGRPVVLPLNVPLLDAPGTEPGMRPLTIEGALDAMGYVRRRREQAKLRRDRLGTAIEAPCDLCDRLLPERHLRIAHVKPRRHCSEEERRDPTNVIVACIECDALFEYRDVVVGDDAMIRAGDGHAHATPALRALVAARAGRRCRAHTPASARWFAAHRDGADA